MKLKPKTTAFTDLEIKKVPWPDFKVPLLTPDVAHIAVISDVHLGHSVVPASKITADLDWQFPDSRLEQLRVIIISGDLFDKRLPHDGDDAFIIARWMENLLIRCKKYNVAIRVLEGTPSHDNRQSRWMVNYNEMMKLGADVKYYPEPAIDELWEGGPTVLYVPDEVNHNATETWLHVNELLRNKGLDKVDFGVMHGFFTYQDPMTGITSHSEERYHNIVRHRIVIGHHHTHSNVGIIVVPGSTDRHKHGQEEDKGHFQFSYSKERGAFDDTLIINTRAMIFETLDVEGKTYLEVHDCIKKLNDYPTGSRLRLALFRTDEVYANMAKLKATFPQFRFDTIVKEAHARVNPTSGLINRPVMTSIRPDTIHALVMPKVSDASAEVLAVIEKALCD